MSFRTTGPSLEPVLRELRSGRALSVIAIVISIAGVVVAIIR